MDENLHNSEDQQTGGLPWNRHFKNHSDKTFTSRTNFPKKHTQHTFVYYW